MSKRDLAAMTSVHAEAATPRTKRRRGNDGASSPQTDEVQSAPTAPVLHKNGDGATASDAQQVKEQGEVLWQTVKNAVNKEGRVLSELFLRLPNKRQWADYYTFIKNPVSLEMIQENLDAGHYSSLEAVKTDIEQCFINAKKYNQRESPIWKDAKSLHKLVKKEYSRMVGRTEDEMHEGGSDEEIKKKKPPSFIRVCKGKLQKLVEKADDTGRVLSTEFMELPSKKLWPEYYKVIQRPLCFEDIFKRLKRKEYLTSADFAKDVETIFDNAITFNADHTPVWEDAQQLRAYFAKLMSDLPEPFSLAQYASSVKIKLKRPALPSSPDASLSAVRPPAAKVSPAITSIAPTPSKATAAPQPAVAPAPMATSTPSLPYMPAQARPPPVAAQPALSYYSKPAAYAPLKPAIAPAPHTDVAYRPKQQSSVSTSASPAPTPIAPLPHPLQSVSITIEPTNRRLDLVAADGVDKWMLRLEPAEVALRVAHVRFVEGAGEVEVDDVPDESTDVDIGDAPKSTKKRRGRPPKARPQDPKENGAKPPKRREPVPIQVSLNGTAMPNATDDKGAEWHVKPTSGMFNVLEVGGKGGVVWKVYVQTSP